MGYSPVVSCSIPILVIDWPLCSVDGETWCVIVRNDIYGDSNSMIINKSHEISLINFYFNKTVFTHFIKKHMFKTLCY